MPYLEDEIRSISKLLSELRPQDYSPPHDEYWDEDGLLQPWAVLIFQSAYDYLEMDWAAPLDDSHTMELREELDALKSLVRSGLRQDKEFVERLHSLSTDAYGILCLAALDQHEDLESLIGKLSNSRTALGKFIEVLEAAPRYVDRQPGPKKDEQLLEFCSQLVRIYRDATGRALGRGYQQSDENYEAPSERFLGACIRPLRPHTTIESLRGLIRKMLKNEKALRKHATQTTE